MSGEASEPKDVASGDVSKETGPEGGAVPSSPAGEPERAPGEAAPLAGADAERDPEDRSFLSYEGARVPRFLAILWIVFLIWGIAYLLFYVPGSLMEWFSRE